MRYSYSSVNLFKECPLRWYFKYGLKIEKDLELVADNPLIVGTLMHEALEIGLDDAVTNYYCKYPVIDNLNIEEVIKVTNLYHKCRKLLQKGTNEYLILTDNFIGYIDLIVENDDGTVDIIDYKYTSNINMYKNSMQLHIYKYMFEKTTGKKVKNLRYLHIPKVSVDKQVPTEQRRLELRKKLEKVQPTFKNVEYDKDKVKEFFRTIKEIENSNTRLYKKDNCWFCEYKNECRRVNI